MQEISEKTSTSDKILIAMVVILYLGGFGKYCHYMVSSITESLKRNKSEKTIPVQKTTTHKNIIDFVSQEYTNQR